MLVSVILIRRLSSFLSSVGLKFLVVDYFGRLQYEDLRLQRCLHMQQKLSVPSACLRTILAGFLCRALSIYIYTYSLYINICIYIYGERHSSSYCCPMNYPEVARVVQLRM